jgi:hypothetical protein
VVRSTLGAPGGYYDPLVAPAIRVSFALSSSDSPPATAYFHDVGSCAKVIDA